MRNKRTGSETVPKYGESANTKALILLEHEEQVKDCLGWLNEKKGQKQIIALSPFAIYELDRHSIPYKIPEDYYDPQELCQLGLDNYQKVEAFCSIIDNSIHQACPIMVEQGIRPALFSLYDLKVVYDAATIRLFQLSKVINAEEPEVILIYGSKSYPFGISEKAPYIFFDNRESVYSHLLTLTGWKASVVVLPCIEQFAKVHSRTESYQGITIKFRNKAAKWLLSHPQLYDLAVAIRTREWHWLFNELRGYLLKNRNIPVVLFGRGYNWDDCREELQSVGIAPVFRVPDDWRHWLSEPFSGKVDSRSLLDTWEGLQADAELRKFFVWQDIDFFPVVRERLQFLVERLTLACLKAYEEVSAVLRNGGIKAVLASTFPTCAGHSAAQAAHNARIPVITWQLGNYGYVNPPDVIYNDIMDADALFVFGEGVVERYSEPARRLGTRLIPVGSASLEALTKRKLQKKAEKLLTLNPEKKVVLYVMTTSHQNYLHISIPPPFSDNHYWRTQQAILDVLAQHPDYLVIVKEHANPLYRRVPLPLYAKENSIENCQFVSDECSFTDLLPLADVLVIDSPSTTLLQALTTSKPTFVYTGHLHIDEDAQRLLERRASCHRDLKSFLDAIDRFLSGGTIDVDLNDEEFLRRYGIADGTSGIRAATVLLDIIQDYPGSYGHHS